MAQFLPEGIYVVSSDFFDREGDVTFPFRGTDYTATIGVNAFARFDHMCEHAHQAPIAPFHGRTFDTPVALVPVGVYKFKSGREFVTVKLTRPITIIGEAMGVSPNAPEDVSRSNPRRNMEESVLEGSLYFGNLVVAPQTDGVLKLDGLTLRDSRVFDARASGDSIGLDVRNCIVEGAHHRCVVETAPDYPGTVAVRECRVDGFDSMEGQGCFLRCCGTDMLVERVYYANTKEFFGLTDYARQFKNAPEHSPARITVRGCAFDHCQGIRGLSFSLPQNAEDVCLTVEDCSFHDFTPEDVPAVYAALPNLSCSLTVRNTAFSTSCPTAAPAILLDAPEQANITLEQVTVQGIPATVDYKPPRRTEAPEYIGEAVWEQDRLDDPHPVCENADETFSKLDAMYSGRIPLHGDMHTHTNSGGTSDGKTPLAEFVRQLKSMDLDFAAIVDHKQILHCLLPEWDDTTLICGTEPAVTLLDDTRPPKARGLHYCMLFRQPSDFFRVMDAFPEFKFTGGPQGHYVYAKLTPDRLTQLSRFIYELGGLVVHAHPKQLMVSDDPMDYYFGDEMPLETILGSADSFDTIQNRNLWESLLKLGKRVHTHGDSDTHREAKNGALTTVYARERSGAAILREVRTGDCAAGAIGIKMAICDTPMGGSLPYRDGLTLAIRLDDYYRPILPDNTVYCLKVYTDRGLAYASEFDAKKPQSLAIPVLDRKYYRVEVTNESDGGFVSISNPIWLD